MCGKELETTKARPSGGLTPPWAEPVSEGVRSAEASRDPGRERAVDDIRPVRGGAESVPAPGGSRSEVGARGLQGLPSNLGGQPVEPQPFQPRTSTPLEQAMHTVRAPVSPRPATGARPPRDGANAGMRPNPGYPSSGIQPPIGSAGGYSDRGAASPAPPIPGGKPSLAGAVPADYAARQDASQFHYLSEKFISQMRESGLILGYDRDSVAKLADQIDADRVGVSREEAERWSNFSGAYLGECLIKCYGGEWRYDDQKSEWAVYLGPSEVGFYPIAKALRHITVGRGDSVLKFFDATENRLQQMANRDSGRKAVRAATFWERLKSVFSRPTEG